MSKRGYISRYLLILKKLKATPYAGFEELQAYVHRQLDFLQMQDEELNMGFSKRTLQRDIREINNSFGVAIEYSKTHKGYFIQENAYESMNFQRMMEAFDMFNSLNLAQDLKPYIHLEKRRPQGTENLYGLLHAIKNRLSIKFSYQKFWEEEISIRHAEPYGLKEFKNRWYVLAKDLNDQKVKTFALDRLTELEITRQHFQYPANYNIEEAYRYCFGISNGDDEKPMEIILSFDSFQGKYIKTLPLHESQEIILDNEDELQIKLTLKPSHELMMELLSFGAEVKVLQPATLGAQIKEAHRKAFEQYL